MFMSPNMSLKIILNRIHRTGPISLVDRAFSASLVPIVTSFSVFLTDFTSCTQLGTYSRPEVFPGARLVAEWLFSHGSTKLVLLPETYDKLGDK